MAWMVWMGLCRREGANADIASNIQTRILQAISDWKFAVRKGFGPVEWCDRPCDIESVELESGWTVGGLNGLFPVADFDAPRLGLLVIARMFQDAGWTECWCTRTIHAVRTLGRTAVPAVIMRQRWSGQTKDVGGASRWTAVEQDGQLTMISAHLPHREKK